MSYLEITQYFSFKEFRCVIKHAFLATMNKKCYCEIKGRPIGHGGNHELRVVVQSLVLKTFPSGSNGDANIENRFVDTVWARAWDALVGVAWRHVR